MCIPSLCTYEIYGNSRNVYTSYTHILSCQGLIDSSRRSPLVLYIHLYIPSCVIFILHVFLYTFTCTCMHYQQSKQKLTLYNVRMYIYFIIDYTVFTCTYLFPTHRRSKQINRRATGVPGRMKLPSFYEQTDPDPSDRPRHPAKRSVSNVSSFHPPPVQPPPILSANPTSPGAKRRLSTEPEVSSQSASSSVASMPAAAGGSNENLTLAPPNEEKRSRESSRQSSVNRLSGLSEDEELGTYEPIDGYLLDKQKSDSMKVPAPQRSVESSPKSQSLSQRSSISDAPHYPAPLPPSKRNKSTSNNEEDEDSDGYEPVQLAGQDDEMDSQFKDEVERAVLPLKPGAMRVGIGQPQPQPRSRERSPSYTGAHPSVALKQFGRERSPTVVQSRVLSESPPTPSILSSSVPTSTLGASHLIRPPIKENSASPPKWADTKSGKVVMPPEPSSPPPSPPVGRDMTSPPVGRPTPVQRQKSPSPPAGQPVLPRKKKTARNPSYESHVLQTQSANDDEGIYSFDRLSPPPPGGVAKATTGSPRRVPSPSNPVTMATGEQQDDVYFDHLVSGGPPLPQKPPIPAHQTSLTSQTSQPDGDNADNIYFDHLSSGPPPSIPPSIPRKTGLTSEQPVQQDEVYFDHLVSGPPPSVPPNVPRKSSTTNEQPVQQDEVYFDHLASGPPTIRGKTGQAGTPRSGLPSVPGKTSQASVPEPQPGGEGGGEDDDQVYFDHLVPTQPVKPVQPVSAPKLPPRRQSSVPSDTKPSNGVKRPVS